MIPWRKVAVRAILAETSMFRFQTTGRGIRSITKPVTTFGIAMYREKATMSMQFPCGMDLSHAYGTGEHWKMAPKMLARPVMMTKNPTIQDVMVKARLTVVKTRM